MKIKKSKILSAKDSEFQKISVADLKENMDNILTPGPTDLARLVLKSESSGINISMLGVIKKITSKGFRFTPKNKKDGFVEIPYRHIAKVETKELVEGKSTLFRITTRQKLTYFIVLE